MKKIDEFWYVLTKALLNDDENTSFLYYKFENLIVIAKSEYNELKPVFRNENLKNVDLTYKNKVFSKFTEVSNKYLLKDSSVIKLNSLGNVIKEAFLLEYFESIPKDYDFKFRIIEELKANNLNKGGIIISKINFNESMRYSGIFGEFLKKFIELNYFSLGISENTEIIW